MYTYNGCDKIALFKMIISVNHTRDKNVYFNFCAKSGRLRRFWMDENKNLMLHFFFYFISSILFMGWERK